MCLISSDDTEPITFWAPRPSIIVSNRRAATSGSATRNSPAALPVRTISAMNANHSPVSAFARSARTGLRRPRLHASQPVRALVDGGVVEHVVHQRVDLVRRSVDGGDPPSRLVQIRVGDDPEGRDDQLLGGREVVADQARRHTESCGDLAQR